MADDILTITVTGEHAGLRLDRFVAAMLPAISRTRAQALIAAGAVAVNGRAARASQQVAAGDVVAIANDATAPPPTTDALPAPERLPVTIVYEDDYLLVVDKPAGMVVHPAPGHAGGTLVHALLAHAGALAGDDVQRPGIVHRLDKDTSGLLIVARDEAAMIALGRQMRERAITKIYLALLEGTLDPPRGAIEAPIGRDPRQRQRMAVTSQGGRAARTLFAAERFIAGRTLARLTLVTGRTHQIRVHCAAIGHPVVGDLTYGRAQPPMPPRMFLHATHLSFAHPITGAPIACDSPLPPDLAGFLAALEAGTAR
jgi:23S rRNA pseudouridine1911/1915/1917 synthase